MKRSSNHHLLEKDEKENVEYGLNTLFDKFTILIIMSQSKQDLRDRKTINRMNMNWMNRNINSYSTTNLYLCAALLNLDARND